MTSLLVFVVEEQKYALPTESVSHVIRTVKVTSVPDLPHCVLGIINLHGQVLPVYSIRRKMNLADRTLTTDVLIVTHAGDRTVALMADAVIGVFVCKDEINLLNLPDREKNGFASCITIKDGIILIPDPERFLSESEEETVTRALADVTPS